LVGYYRGADLHFAGKVGTGFTAKTLAMLSQRLHTLKRGESPFHTIPSALRRANWVEPKLVCQIRFSEWTRDGKLRQGAFLGLRKDKDARDVVRETVTPL
jgi:bifunctional non-homologous end joining protein LigD